MYRTWIFSDESHRASQALAVARYLATEVVVITIAQCDHAGGLASLLQHTMLPLPTYVLGVGQAVREHLKVAKQLLPQSFVVQILDPYQDYEWFDLMVIPAHEPHTPRENITTTTGLITQITTDFLVDVTVDVPLPSSPYTVMLLGGKHLGGDVLPEDVCAMLEVVQPLIAAEGGSLLLTNSPRTDSALMAAVMPYITVPNMIYDWKGARQMPNPYRAFLKSARRIVVTGDSLRMMSEVCSAGAMVYIANPADATRGQPRYAALHQLLVAGGHAKFLSHENIALEWPPVVLNEARRIAEIIQTRAKQKKC